MEYPEIPDALCDVLRAMPCDFNGMLRVTYKIGFESGRAVGRDTMSNEMKQCLKDMQASK